MHMIIEALLLDVLLGDPRGIPHPVEIIGRLIAFLDKKLWTSSGGAKLRGLLLTACVLAATGCTVFMLLEICSLLDSWIRYAAELYLLYAALAYRSLRDESFKVYKALDDGDLDAARHSLSYIVGRDTERLDEKGVVRACVETIAEGYVDGIASPLFWMAVGGCFGQAALFAWLFKAASTMDSMIGYNDERYHDFGWAAARLDDILNFVPARLGGLLAVAGGLLAGCDARAGWKIFRRDRLRHKSPNSAHGESAFAGLLGVRLGGGAFYGGVFEQRPFLGDALREPEKEDILRSHRILTCATALCAACVYLCGLLL